MSKIAIATSAVIHAALIAALAAGAWLMRPPPAGVGPGDGVEVWLATPGPSGGGGARPRRGEIGRRTEERREGAEAAAGEATPQVASAADGAGLGVGGGDGAGGSGGDPVLARIRRRIDGAKYYPRAARMGRLEGAPRVAFEIGEDGRIRSARIASSCGERALDDAAVEAVQRAAPLPYYPGEITVTVRYSLNR